MTDSVETNGAQQRRKHDGPLCGIKVARWGRSRSGDFLVRLLSDHGATVEDLAATPQRQLGYSASQATVIIEDVGRGAGLPIALSYDRIAADNPRLVYCRLVSFPEGAPACGPELEDEPVLAAIGLNRYARDTPQTEPLPVPSFCAAVMAATQISCALLPHIANGGPQFIEVPLFSATLNMVGRELVTVKDKRFADPSRNNPRLPIAELYQCADGRWVQPHGMYPHFVEILCRVAGHPEWAEEPAAKVERLSDGSVVPLWRQRFKKLFKERSAKDWEDSINAALGACTVCLHHEEWMAEPHARASGMFRLDDVSGRWRVGPGVAVVPNRGQADPSRVRGMMLKPPRDGAKPLPLDGLRVIDFCIVIAGPTCGRILADLGADVVKIEAPDREIAPYLWLDVNRGKRSIVLDLRAAAGRRIAQELVRDADVVTENFRIGKLDAVGLGYERLTAERPDLVYASLNALDHHGPWARRAGWEHNGQAASGMQWARNSGDEPQQVPFPVNDFATGMLGALGVVLALLRRELTGQGGHVLASLVRSATFLQLESFENENARPRLHTVGIKCSDGWISAIIDQGSTALTVGAPALQARTCNEAIAELAVHGVSAFLERRPKDLVGDSSWLIDQGLLVRWNHPALGELVQATPRATASAFQSSKRFPAPVLGADTEEILRGAGCSEAQVEELLASGAAIKNRPLFVS
jgi:crotonobetainyl-CoA:carnitine CoA-transferase CaiB-like acyl-CoA transferase